MTEEEQKLSDQIRSGAIECYCPGYMRTMAEHLPRCQWDRAIKRIYELGRKEDNESNN